MNDELRNMNEDWVEVDLGDIFEIDGLDYTPFDSKGGKGKMYQLFGNDMNEIINELNEVLAA